MDIPRLKNSFKFAANGLASVWEKEQNLRIMFCAAFIVILLAAILCLDWLRMFALIVTICMVLSLEVMNSSFEKYIDKRSPEKDKSIGTVKDILAGAVLLSVLASVFIGLIVFYKPVIDLFIK